MAKKKPLTKEEREAKNLARNLKNMEVNKAKHEKAKAKKKQKTWTHRDIENYFNHNKQKDDFSCSKSGIVESRYASTKKKK